MVKGDIGHGVWRPLLAAGFLVLAFSGIQPARPSEAAEPLDARVEATMQFREEFGLAADLPTVTATASKYGLSPDYGVYLSPKEEMELHGRERLHPVAADVSTYIAAHSTAYGGNYIDQRRGGKLVILTVGTASNSIDAIDALVPGDTPFETKQVQRSLFDLRRTQATIDADFDVMRRLGYQPTTTGLDIVRNEVILGVANPSPTFEDWAAERYGDGVRVQLDEGVSLSSCTRDDCSGYDLRGGLHIFSKNGTVTNNCTAAFVARARSTTTIVPYLITAGHCADPLTTWGTWRNPLATTIGTVSRMAWRDNSTADAAAFRIAGDRVSNMVYPAMLVMSLDLNQVPGTQIKKSGATSGVTAGQITSVEHHIYTCEQICVDLYGMVLSTVDAKGGDSGAPYMQSNGSTAVGVLHGNPLVNGKADTTRSYYSPIEYVLNELQLGICLNSTCSSSW